MTYRTQQRRKALYQALVKCLAGSLLVTTLLSPSLAQEQGGVGKPQRIPTWASESARRYRPEFYQPQGQQDRIDLPAAVANAQLFVPPAPSVSPNCGGGAQLPDPRYALQPPATSVTVPATNGPFVPAPLPQPNATSVAYQHEQPVRLPAPNDNPLPASEATASGEDPAYYGSPYAYAAQCGCDDFAPTPIPNGALVHDPCAAQNAYDNKQYVPTQRPWLELGFPFYGPGTLPPSSSAFSFFNPIRQKFYLYGDLRTGVGAGKNAVADTQNWAARLNLDADWQLTPTGRLHGGFQPLTQGVQFTRVEFGQNSEFVQELNPNFVTGFFEGDLGALAGGLQDTTAPFDMPFTVGLIPLFYQNGIWMEDAMVGAAVAIPSQHNRTLKWSNYDATVFAGIDNLNSPAFNGDQNAGRIVGTAWFIEAYEGYIEADYAYLHDYDGLDRSYHNVGIAYTRRYFMMISNSVRGIFNFGQNRSNANQTADGMLFIVENSLISPLPLQLVPYANAFVGIDRPQSAARAGQAGGILRNTGINFESDGLNGYPTLDASGNNTCGGAVGVNWLGLGLDRQVVFETAYVHGFNAASSRALQGDELALGARLQYPLSNATLLRFDTMYGFRDSIDDIWGLRAEWRWKF